jgi:hypothetical protein
LATYVEIGEGKRLSRASLAISINGHELDRETCQPPHNCRVGDLFFFSSNDTAPARHVHRPTNGVALLGAKLPRKSGRIIHYAKPDLMAGSK